MKAVPQNGKWQVWFRTIKQAQTSVPFHPFGDDLFNDSKSAIASLQAFLDQRSQTPWLFTESGKFLGRSLENWQA
jgi:hypothetical protein